MTPRMSGLRFAICLSLASIVFLAYAGTAAALDGSHLPGSAGAGLGGGFGLAVSAILVAFLFLAAPRYGRRLRPTAELARPPALLSVLERPG